MSEDGGIKKLFRDLHDTVPVASKLIAEMRETIHSLEMENLKLNALVAKMADASASSSDAH